MDKEEMIYYDNWVRRDLPSYMMIGCLYMGPRFLNFGYDIMRGRYDDLMDEEILAYYKDYFKRNPSEAEPFLIKILKEVSE